MRQGLVIMMLSATLRTCAFTVRSSPRVSSGLANPRLRSGLMRRYASTEEEEKQRVQAERERRKAEKEAAKAAKKLKKQQEALATAEEELRLANIRVSHLEAAHSPDRFGDYETIRSQGRTTRVFSKVENVHEQLGQEIWLRGRVANVRAKGNAAFLVLRDGVYHTVQV